ncbi:MAG: uL30 family ribosomal protein [Candidatus Woesearchaeota archaeon]
MYAVVRIRGNTGLKPDVRKTFELLNLPNQHNCVLVQATPQVLGMLKRIQGYATYGPVSQEVVSLLEKRKEQNKKYIRLAPPRQGFERKGIKKPFSVGGALGDRKEAINDLLKRMV